MKHMIKLPVVILGLMLLFGCTTQKAMAQDDDISLDVFYDELAPYGDWTQDPEYGDVWRPNVDMSNFRPYYTDGHWAMTEYGNTWVSDYEWGWAPFHYGRWVLNRFNDWIWIPDTVWGPAWVSWREGNGYYGWAPLSPGLNVDVNIGSGGYDIPSNWWVFIPQINIYNTSYPRYYYRNNNYFNRTRYINYTYGSGRHNYYTGPRANDIRRVTRRDVTVYNISRTNRPGRTSINNNNINIYNPGRGGRGNNASFGQTGRNNTPGRTGGATNVRPGQPDRNTPRRDNNTPGQRPNVEGRQGRDGAQPSVGRNGQNNPQQAQQRQEQMQRQQRDGQRRNQERSGQNDPQQAQQRQEQMQRQQRDAQNNQQQAQQRQEQMQRQQRDAQNNQQQAQQRQEQMQRQQRDGQQRDQQRQEMQRQQRDAQNQQRQQQQQAQQQRQQQDQQRQQQAQQQQAQQQQRQQQDQQRQQQDQQRQQQAQQQQQQRQQQDQQRQQQRSQEQSRPTRTEGSRSGRGN
jgi:hypothetical protein